MSPDSYIYCSPFLNVVSLDELLDQPSEDVSQCDFPDPQPTVDCLIDRQRAYNAIKSALNNLPPRQRTAICTIFFAECSITETARRMRISAPAVVKLRTKAIEHLNVTLAPKRDLLFT